MNKNFPATTVRQPKLHFEQDDIWQRLHASARNECQGLVTGLLVQALEIEAEAPPPPRSDDER